MSNALPAEAEQIAGHSHRRRPWYRVLYVQVLIAVAIGIAIGFFFPEFGKALKPLGDGFIKLVKMIIAPIIFCTVVHGIASMRDGKKLGRLGIKTLVYFEVVSTFALIIGLLVVNLWPRVNALGHKAVCCRRSRSSRGERASTLNSFKDSRRPNSTEGDKSSKKSFSE